MDELRVNIAKSSVAYHRSLWILYELYRVLFREVSTPLGETLEDMCHFEASGMPIEAASHILPNMEVNFVGAGMALAGVAVPAVSNATRLMVQIESRTIGYGKSKSIERSTLRVSGRKQQQQQQQQQHQSLDSFMCTTPSVEDLHSGKAFSLRDYLVKAAKQVQAGSASLARGSFSVGQIAGRNSGGRVCSQQSISLYYFTEMQFIMSLVDLSERLILIPKDERLKALSAELTLINHNLPASICIPLWCSSGGEKRVDVAADQEAHKSHDYHHRILRISPNDAVVLNSAERAPFLVHIEVLEGYYSDEGFEEIKRAANQSVWPPIVRGGAMSTTVVDQSSAISTFSAPNDEGEGEGEGKGKGKGEDGGSIVEKKECSPKIAHLEDDILLSARTGNELEIVVAPLSADDFKDRMRTAAIMLAQLARQAAKPDCPSKKLADIGAIKTRIIREMEQLEKNRLFDALQIKEQEGGVGVEGGEGGDKRNFLVDVCMPLDRRDWFDREDPSAVVFQEPLEEKTARIQSSSPYGQVEGWRLLSVIVKSGCDMRQEHLACQVIAEMTKIWNDANLPLWTFS